MPYKCCYRNNVNSEKVHCNYQAFECYQIAGYTLVSQQYVSDYGNTEGSHIHKELNDTYKENVANDVLGILVSNNQKELEIENGDLIIQAKLKKEIDDYINPVDESKSSSKLITGFGSARHGHIVDDLHSIPGVILTYSFDIVSDSEGFFQTKIDVVNSTYLRFRGWVGGGGPFDTRWSYKVIVRYERLP